MDLKTVCGLDIPQEVREWCKNHSDGRKHFASFLQYIDGEIVERVFATRLYKGKGLHITEVYRNSTGKSAPVYKNLIYSRMAGYTPVFEAKDIYYRSGGYPCKAFGKEDFDVWDVPVMPMGIWRVYVNADMLKEVEEFKYCGYSCGDVINYLRNYRRDNSIELMGKMGIPLSPALIGKCKEDKQFRRFVFDNRDNVAVYGTQATIYAYKNHLPIDKARDVCFLINQNNRMCARLVPEVKGTKIDRVRLMDYLEEIGDEYGNRYDDYLKAIKGLKLDLNDTKNVFPKDFNRMHDLRAAEYASNIEKIDAERRKKLYKQFSRKAEELKRYALEGDIYSLIIPQSITDLIREGEQLSHCVGKMGYDKKVVDGKSLIAFVRKTSEIDKPFVTVEYRLDENKLRQCYGFKDSRPEEAVLSFVDMWADMITRERIGGNT